MELKDMPVVTVEQITRFRSAALAEIDSISALASMQHCALLAQRDLDYTEFGKATASQIATVGALQSNALEAAELHYKGK